ncbi:MAG: FAD-dependent monooxygenase [Candidatus Promineifilaceae bacterium]|nr:FAD-dependent monooxygenase [Candidatus Promineifilaceae bacterium]
MAEIEKIDVLIVGSGPSGTSTALHLVKSDPSWASRIVILEKAIHPREKLCGGGVLHMGTNILARLGLEFEPDHFKVREVRLVYQDRSYSLYGNPIFRITRRDEFDHWLVRTAENLGVCVRQGEAVTDIVTHEDYVEVTTKKATFHAKVVVGADGSRSFIRRRLKWDDDSRVARLVEVLTPEDPTIQPEFRDGVAIFDFTHMTDGLQGYYWDFPSYVEGKAFMNRGLFDSRARPEREKADLKNTLSESMAKRDRDLNQYKLKGHPIRWWSRDGRFAIPRVLLVGDAAGADPLFGEGISFALGYGMIAADEINDAFKRQDFSFMTYKERLTTHPLFKQLDIRTRLARFAYLLRSPWLIRLGWRIAPLFARFSRWHDPEYNPTETPSFKLIDLRQST